MSEFFVPVKDRIAVVMDDLDQTTQSGLYIPATATRRVTSGTVLAVGDEVEEVSTGDRVMISPYSTGVEIEILDKKLLIIQEKDVLGIVRAEECQVPRNQESN